MDRTELCRLCALQKNNLLSIFGEEGIRLSIENKINKCLNIKLNEQNYLPKSICMECCSKLDAFDEFLESISNAQDTLRHLYSKNDLSEPKHLIDEDLKNFGNAEDADFEERENFNLDALSGEKDNHSYGCNVESVPLNDGSNVQNKSILNLTHDNTTSNGEVVANDRRKAEWDLDTWLCTDCSEELSSVDDLRQHHLSEHKQEPKYMCVYCSKLFLLYSAFVSHLKRHRNSLKYNCHECGKGFSNKKVLDTHTLTHSDARPYTCQDCGKSFRQQSSLYIHSRCHLPDDVKNKFPCDLCNKRFSTKPNLVTHMSIHTGIRNFTCDQCGKSFIKKGNLDAHLLTHSHDKPFSCELCNKRFKTGMQLRKHHTVHTGAKPYQCDVCGRTFREKGTLREHQRIHTGAMPFTCEYCGKTFRFKGILTTHRRQHTGERPYSCLECQHHFTNWPNYNKHMKRRHGINTSRSTRTNSNIAAECEVAPSHVYQDMQSSADLYQTHPTYLYNVCSLSQVTAIDPILI